MSIENLFIEAGFRIAELRGSLTQAAFADALGVDRKTVVRWEAGERLPDGKSLLALLETFGADVNYILSGRGKGGKSDAAEAALLHSFRRCTHQGRMTLIQTAALLCAGADPVPTEKGSSVIQNIYAPVRGGVAGKNIINKRSKS